MTQNITLINADVIDGLKSIDKNSIDTILTSPPYYGLRDYGIDGQIGMESTLEEYHDRLLEVTAQLKRVMKPTAVLYWNHGDSYDEKSLTMQNERLIIRMIDEQGWILRNRIIWYAPNKMPSSAQDRFTNKYEPIYMLVKNQKYNFDLTDVKIPTKYQEVWSRKGSGKDTPYEETGNNPRSRWGLTKQEIKSGVKNKSSALKNPGDCWFSDNYHGNRKYKINERYFKDILTEEQAYWLGFLWGDGSISDGQRVRLSLQTGDVEHVIRFKNAINSEHLIKPMGNGIGIEFGCIKMVKDLENLKLKTSFPDIPEFLWRHFIRGFFDADGCIYEGKPGEYEVSITNENTKMLNFIQVIISTVVNSKQRNILKDNSVWRIRWCGTNQCRGIRDYLYSNSNIFLPRKFKSFPDGKVKWSKNIDFWIVPTQPHKDAHFAIMADALVEPMIKAGCPKDGIVLDPFAGSGTTMKVAKALGRSAIGIELSEEYCEIIKRNLLFHQYTFGNIVNKFVKL